MLSWITPEHIIVWCLVSIIACAVWSFYAVCLKLERMRCQRDEARFLAEHFAMRPYRGSAIPKLRELDAESRNRAEEKFDAYLLKICDKQKLSGLPLRDALGRFRRR